MWFININVGIVITTRYEKYIKNFIKVYVK